MMSEPIVHQLFDRKNRSIETNRSLKIIFYIFSTLSAFFFYPLQSLLPSEELEAH